MGLDMYLIRRDKAGKYREYEAAEWGKANHIRQWFVNNTGYPKEGNTMLHKVTREQLENLVSDCLKVMEDKSLAKKIMPTAGGYFFGDTNIDKYYFGKLQVTVEMVTEVIDETDWDNEDIYYYESW